MKKAFSFDIVGMDKVLAGLKSAPAEIQSQVEDAFSASAMIVEQQAVLRAPVDVGGGGAGLRGGVSSFKSGDIQFDVVSAALYSAFVEFGTGALVDVPAGLEDYAMQFKGQGIRQVNLPARPFLFNSWEEEKPRLIMRIQEILKSLK